MKSDRDKPTDKAVIYARVSSREQEETGYSLPSQVTLLQEYAKRHELDVRRVFPVAESASGAKQRAVFAEMMEYMRKNSIPHLLCEKVDRLTRNLKEAVAADDWIKADESRHIHFIKNNLVINKDASSDHEFRWGIEIVLARKYISNLSEEVKKGQKEKIAQGWLPTKLPLGYKTIGDAGHKIHVIDEEKAPFIRRMFELYSTGNYSVIVLTEAMHKEGLRNRVGKKVGKSRMYDMLRDPFYYGDMRWKGEVQPAKHEPLISHELFDRVQMLLSRSLNQPQFNKHIPTFKAKMTCTTCGGSVTWERQKGHWYGHCNGYKRAGMKEKCEQRHMFVREEKVEEELFPMLINVAPKNKRVLEILNEALKESHADEITRYNTNLTNLNAAIERSQRRLEALYEDKLDTKINSETYERLFKRYTVEKDEATREIARLNKGNKKYYEAGYAIHELASKAMEIYKSEHATVEDRRLLLSYSFQNITLKGREVKPEYTFAFDFLANWVPKLNKISEPQKTVENPRQKEPFGSSHPVLLRG
ncbi:MAG: recombinase family protein [Candidatus Yonathbacteria bacterium]|nr:recombinase family protein [Candidatus Yonathbacteria bacterium]